ncbi:YgiT-type zinc finger protein [Thermoanaerobacterium thermosulfurigenes]|uniref:YgiT-type zinc finger protein n=1 Tax=Thermoanaerobacterium thermosulfurigenes TaxID=33950 RepID=UPI003F4A3D30
MKEQDGANIMNDRCFKCGGKLEKKEIRIEKWIEDKLIVIEHVPVMECVECGERYFDANTSLKLDEYFYEKKPVKTIEVPVFEYKEY